MILLRACCLGGGMGLLADAFRTIRLHFRLRRRGTALLDGLFWGLSLPVFLLFFLHFTDGRLRFYLPLGLLAGFLLYRRTISPAVLWLLEKALTALHRCVKKAAAVLLWSFSFPRGQ